MTVGYGISPYQSLKYRESWTVRITDVCTTGRELHPAPKYYLFDGQTLFRQNYYIRTLCFVNTVFYKYFYLYKKLTKNRRISSSK